jgi:phosphoribosylaminoimidazole-succinocarboxamide synthase
VSGRDRGSASVWLLAIGLVVLSAGLAGASVGAAHVARHQAQVAADLGALAGAARSVEGSRIACQRAGSIATANGARMVACDLDELDLTITVEVAPASGLSRPATATARAGPIRADDSRGGVGALSQPHPLGSGRTMTQGATVELLHSGKVRELYADGDDLILVASDRVSVYDVVLPTPIPDKGKILTRLSLWWFERLADLVPHHVISAADVPSRWAGRAIRCRRLEIVPVECVARGYLAGSGLQTYRETGGIGGIALPADLVEGSRLPEPIFTPTTKAPPGEHDELMTHHQVRSLVGVDTAEKLREVTLRVYARGAEQAAESGLIVADTKLEFGWTSDGSLVLADEVLTPDSSRFWPADQWQPGRPQFAFDKQFLRDWAASTGWDRQPPAPEVPPDIVEATRARYIDAYERLTGHRWS